MVQGDRTSGFSTETIKNAVKSAVQEEDRSKNVMVFGLNERKVLTYLVVLGKCSSVLERSQLCNCVEWGNW